MFYLSFSQSVSSLSLPCPSAGFFILSRVKFPQLINLLYCYLRIATGENNAFSLFGSTMEASQSLALSPCNNNIQGAIPGSFYSTLSITFPHFLSELELVHTQINVICLCAIFEFPYILQLAALKSATFCFLNQPDKFSLFITHCHGYF